MGNFTFVSCYIRNYYGWVIRFNRMEGTKISSNSVALMLILNMAMNIHLTVRFLQLKKEFPDTSKQEAVISASKKMMLPILYTVLTTVCAFLPLILVVVDN